ncbi:MAG: metal-dependent hydrolase [Altererythrobacter sp.]|nr:metal-dependent hydrolase [Altererythrobacter sp.]
MDNLTHSLVGALLGQAGLKRKTGLAMPALIIGANLPDVDATSLLWLEGVQHLAFRRGITHGPIAWVLLPLILAGALWWWDRWQGRRGTRPEKRLPVRFGWLYGLALLATLTHPALDWLNVYGIRLLEPFSSRWFYGDVLFIIDVWMWALLGFATWFSLRREKRGGNWMRPARIAGAVGLAYVGMSAALSKLAADGNLSQSPYRNGVIASPVPLNPLKRELLVRDLRGYWWAANWSLFGDHRPTISQIGQQCANGIVIAVGNTEVDAFLFWSRARMAERAPDGSVLIRDARFYDPRARDRFTVALKDVRCEPINSPPLREGLGEGVRR